MIDKTSHADTAALALILGAEMGADELQQVADYLAAHPDAVPADEGDNESD